MLQTLQLFNVYSYIGRQVKKKMKKSCFCRLLVSYLPEARLCDQDNKAHRTKTLGNNIHLSLRKRDWKVKLYSLHYVK